ncbi:DUF625-domain-containing protein [Wolfiporia cocos MD-104 SS10]|uniref:DUF625-domain-containing protein n=1 Tax=Wolfiporia cocos (strain MD-104) TaxID=742152 RepID=A0A2H3JEW4_WOLCO|nr:DUF625-domain-containing protein [Wolfiporia cocos MD-104 SS10]
MQKQLEREEAAADTEMAGARAEGEQNLLEGADAERDLNMAATGDDMNQWSDEDSHDLKRVKVYELVASRWIDQGTAFCFGDFTDSEALIVARAENDFDKIILSTTIRSNDVYQRQQDTLIVWTEPNGVDYALSFQDAEGCAEVWHFILEVQRRMSTGDENNMHSSSPLLESDPSIGTTATAHLIRTGRLPHPELGTMSDIERAIKILAQTSAFKERICEYIISEEYIKAMIVVLYQAEYLESLHHLHALCTCMQAILMLNEPSLYEHILDDELFLGVVGMLEYDPEFPTHKANYREFLRQTSHFHQPIPIRDETIQKKVHYTYRLQFLKDVVLARAIDDSTFNVLNSAIIYNQIDIISHVQNDPTFLREVVGIFLDPELITALGLDKGKEVQKNAEDKMDVDAPEGKANGTVRPSSASSSASPTRGPSDAELIRRREVVFLIQQLCVMGKNVQLPARIALFRTLVDRGILFAVQWALSQLESDEDGKQMIAAAGEILTALLDHDLNGVRGHVLKQLGAMEREKANGKKIVEKETFLALLCRLLVRSRDLAVQSQIGESLRTLMEIQGDANDLHPAMTVKAMQRNNKDDPGVERFLDYFYKQCVDSLFRPLEDVPDFKSNSPLTISRERANLYLYLCDLLASFTLQHSFRSHFFVLSSNLSTRIATLLRAKDKHLRLAAFRFFRTCVKLHNPNMLKHLIKFDVFEPILNLTLLESRRDNLISASCQEFFECLRRENVKEAIHHCMTRHGAKIRQLAETPLGGPRFQGLIRRWEINIAPPPPEEKAIEQPVPNGPRRWGQGKLLEAEEEDYFNADDDDEEDNAPPLVSVPLRGGPPKRRRLRGMSVPGRITRRQHQPPAPQPLSALVPYDDDGDLAELSQVDSSDDPSPPSLPRRGAATTSNYFSAFPTPSDGPPASPRIPHKQISPSNPEPSYPPDEQDDLLEQLFSAGPSSSKPPDLAAAGKRRREDEDDELLERLASRGKRPSVGGSPAKENLEGSPAAKASLSKPGEEGPKKIKMKFGAVGAAVASSLPAAFSDPGTKEGDNG